jgi:hypothetical protein
LALSLLALPVSASLEVGSVASSRFGGGWTLDGAFMVRTRAKLLRPGNFSPAVGVVGTDIDITDVAVPLSAPTLAAFDVFFIGFINDGTFSASELSSLRDWVVRGGTLLVTCDTASFNDVCELFGRPRGGSATAPMTPAPGQAGHPLFSGPFGVASSMSLAGGASFFQDLVGPTVLGVDADGDPMLMVEELGQGIVVFLGDIDVISDFGLTDSTTIDPTNDNDIFLGNLFAALINVGCPGENLCLRNGRFVVSVTWETTSSSGVGHPIALTDDSGSFWFFDPANSEMIVKVLNACPINNRYWVFAGGLSNVRVRMEVRDVIAGGPPKVYINPQGTAFQPIQDTSAFATCP